MTRPGRSGFDAWCTRCSVLLDVERFDGSDPHRGHVNEVLRVPKLYALSVFDSWAWAIDSLPEDVRKDVENRERWGPYRWVCHRWIALHVAQQFEREEVRHRIASLSGQMPPSKYAAESLERRGKITAVVRVDGAWQPHEDGGGKWRIPAWFGWHIGAVVKLATPIAAAGGQKLWRVPIPSALQIFEQLPADVVGALAFPT